MMVYSFQKLVIEPYEAFDVVSAGTVNFSKQKILQLVPSFGAECGVSLSVRYTQAGRI